MVHCVHTQPMVFRLITHTRAQQPGNLPTNVIASCKPATELHRVHLHSVYTNVLVKRLARSRSTSARTNDRWREPCLYIQRLGVKPARHTRTDINNARPRPTPPPPRRCDSRWVSERSVRGEADRRRPVHPGRGHGRRALAARVGYRPDKTLSRERRVARTERMPVVHGPEWPRPTTCPPGRRRYLCSSNIKTPGNGGGPPVAGWEAILAVRTTSRVGGREGMPGLDETKRSNCYVY